MPAGMKETDRALIAPGPALVVKANLPDLTREMWSKG